MEKPAHSATRTFRVSHTHVILRIHEKARTRPSYSGDRRSADTRAESTRIEYDGLPLAMCNVTSASLLASGL